jgi:hypothetical protein
MLGWLLCAAEGLSRLLLVDAVALELGRLLLVACCLAAFSWASSSAAASASWMASCSSCFVSVRSGSALQDHIQRKFSDKMMALWLWCVFFNAAVIPDPRTTARGANVLWV